MRRRAATQSQAVWWPREQRGWSLLTTCILGLGAGALLPLLTSWDPRDDSWWCGTLLVVTTAATAVVGWRMRGWGHALAFVPACTCGLLAEVWIEPPTDWLRGWKMALVMWLVGTPLCIGPSIGVYAIIRRRREVPLSRFGPSCPDCGYCLRGNTSGLCPECGHPVERLDLLGHPTDHRADSDNQG